MRNLNAKELAAELNAYDDGKATHVEKIKLAQASLRFAINLMESVAHETKNGHAEAYVIDHLEIITSADHGFVSNDFDLDDWIKELEGKTENDAS